MKRLRKSVQTQHPRRKCETMSRKTGISAPCKVAKRTINVSLIIQSAAWKGRGAKGGGVSSKPIPITPSTALRSFVSLVSKEKIHYQITQSQDSWLFVDSTASDNGRHRDRRSALPKPGEIDSAGHEQFKTVRKQIGHRLLTEVWLRWLL